MRIEDIPQFHELSVAEKILLVEDIWDSIADDEGNVPVARSHKEELDKRMQCYNSDPGKLLSFEELRVQVDRGR